MDLSNNKIENIPQNCLSYAQNLKILNLENNSISNNLTGVGTLEKLRMLNLRNNRIKNMDTVHHMSSLKSLQFLDLGKNQLVEDYAFEYAQFQYIFRKRKKDLYLGKLKLQYYRVLID